MFAYKFLQLRSDKGEDYCLSDFGFFCPPILTAEKRFPCQILHVKPFCPWWCNAPFGRRSSGGTDLSVALWHFPIRFMKPILMDATSATVVTWGFISLGGRGSLPPPSNICSDLHTNGGVCQEGWLMRGKLSMMSSLDRREEGLCYYYAGGAPRPVFLRRGTARVSPSLFDEARYDP